MVGDQLIDGIVLLSLLPSRSHPELFAECGDLFRLSDSTDQPLSDERSPFVRVGEYLAHGIGVVVMERICGVVVDILASSRCLASFSALAGWCEMLVNVMEEFRLRTKFASDGLGTSGRWFLCKAPHQRPYLGNLFLAGFLSRVQ